MDRIDAINDWNDLFYFSQVVDKGGFAAAARALHIPKSRLSRRVAELEQRLGLRLLQRSTRRLQLTDVGARFLQHCQAMLQEAEAAQALVLQARAEPSGRLRVSCPGPMAQDQLAGILPRFLLQYPRLRLELLVVNRAVDLLREEVDVALRVRPPAEHDLGLATRRFRHSESVCVAAPALLAELAVQEPSGLQHCAVLGMARADWKLHWNFSHADGRQERLQLTPRLAADDFNVIRAAAVAGVGVAVLPLAYCRHQLDSGQLQRLLPDWHLPASIMHAVYASRQGLAPGVRAFLDFLAAELGDE